MKYWATFNEPRQVCLEGYGNTQMAPGLNQKGVAEYKCAHTLLKAHAEVYHLYDDVFRKRYNGKGHLWMVFH